MYSSKAAHITVLEKDVNFIVSTVQDTANEFSRVMAADAEEPINHSTVTHFVQSLTGGIELSQVNKRNPNCARQE